MVYPIVYEYIPFNSYLAHCSMAMLVITRWYPLVNKQLDPENHQFFMKTSLPTPMTARVYVNLPEGNIHSEFLSTFHLAIDGHRYFVEMFGAGAFLVTGRLKADCSSARNLAHLQAACVAAVGLAGRKCEFAPQGVENPSIPLGRPV